jgi:hypothetical protein
MAMRGKNARSEQTKLRDLPLRKIEQGKADQVNGSGVIIHDVRGAQRSLSPCI